MILEGPMVIVATYKPKTEISQVKRVYDLNGFASIGYKKEGAKVINPKEITIEEHIKINRWDETMKRTGTDKEDMKKSILFKQYSHVVQKDLSRNRHITPDRMTAFVEEESKFILELLLTRTPS